MSLSIFEIREVSLLYFRHFIRLVRVWARLWDGHFGTSTESMFGSTQRQRYNRYYALMWGTPFLLFVKEPEESR